MKDYLIKIAVKTGFSQPITGDQINGAFLYYLSLTDKKKFDQYYSSFKNDQPAYLFSSIFPEDTIPFDGHFLAERFFADASKDQIKQLKKISFLSKNLFNDSNSLKKMVATEQQEQIIKDRLIKVSIKNETLYTQEIINFSRKKADVYLRVFYPDFPFTSLPEFFSFFLGKKVSTGLSHLILLNYQEINLPRSGGFFVNLSPFIPTPAEKSYYQPITFSFFTKFPKIGIKQAENNPFKKKIVLIKEGSVFESLVSEKLIFLGSILENVSVNNKIIQIAYSFPYFFNL